MSILFAYIKLHIPVVVGVNFVWKDSDFIKLTLLFTKNIDFQMNEWGDKDPEMEGWHHRGHPGHRGRMHGELLPVIILT